ncbi:MAG: hypothetical protein Q4G68_05085 [Planctomycetia bacterium]|nr:hypothetical protein [Planctomycetia bacterium]
MQKAVLFIVVSVLIIFASGCNSNVRVHGQIQFDDGTPLTCGTVVFDDGMQAARGDLDSEGNYRLGGEYKNDGVPPGNYKVYIIGACQTVTTGESAPSPDAGSTKKPVSLKGKGAPRMRVTPLIHSRFTSRDKTDLSCEVTGSTREVNFTVERAEP